MSETRATKSGSALDNQRKIDSKYSEDIGKKCMEWIKEATKLDLDTNGNCDCVRSALRDGTVLVCLYDVIQPGTFSEKVKKPSKLPFQIMDKLENFTKKIKGKPLEIPEHCVFTSVDLVDGVNMPQVLTCLEAIARKCRTLGLAAGGFGPKEAEANKREFTEEQLAEGKSVIGLQMGSNKGASQSGQNFGKGRMITD